jgi:hypothetical protein
MARVNQNSRGLIVTFKNVTTWIAEELSGRLEVSLKVVSRKRIEVVFKCKKGKQFNPFPTSTKKNKIK